MTFMVYTSKHFPRNCNPEHTVIAVSGALDPGVNPFPNKFAFVDARQETITPRGRDKVIDVNG